MAPRGAGFGAVVGADSDPQVLSWTTSRVYDHDSLHRLTDVTGSISAVPRSSVDARTSAAVPS
jgi:hypothetical protein